MSRQLTVIVRSGCHLCDDMLAALDKYRAKHDFAIAIVDIMGNAELEARYEAHKSRIEHELEQRYHWKFQRFFWGFLAVTAWLTLVLEKVA